MHADNLIMIIKIKTHTDKKCINVKLDNVGTYTEKDALNLLKQLIKLF